MLFRLIFSDIEFSQIRIKSNHFLDLGKPDQISIERVMSETLVSRTWISSYPNDKLNYLYIWNFNSGTKMTIFFNILLILVLLRITPAICFKFKSIKSKELMEKKLKSGLLQGFQISFPKYFVQNLWDFRCCNPVQAQTELLRALILKNLYKET